MSIGGSSASEDRATDCGCSSRTVSSDGSTIAATAGQSGLRTGTATSSSAGGATSIRVREWGSAGVAVPSFSRIPSLADSYPPVHSAAHRPCTFCGTTNPDSFLNGRSQLCHDCRLAIDDDSHCRICGVDLPPKPATIPRRVCSSRRCRLEYKSRAFEARDPNADLSRKPTTKVCRGFCGRELPRTIEFFPPTVARADGEPRLLSFCRSCANARKRDHYATNETMRETIRRLSSERAARIRERMKVDPEFAREHRARQAAATRKYNAKKRKGQPRRSGSGVPTLDARPLAAAARAYARRRGEGIDVALGASRARSVRRWESGELVSVDLCDEMLIVIGALWWEVYEVASVEGMTDEELAAARADADLLFGGR